MIESPRWIPGNQPMPLDADATPALVLSGSAVVFAVDKETGARRPLFCVDPGEPLLPLPCPPGASWTIVAVPLTSSGLELGRDTREWAGVVALENWLAKIGEAFATFRETGPVRLIQPGQRITLATGERAAIAEGVTFVRIEAGAAVLAGALVSADSVVALVPGLWLEAAGDAEWFALQDPPDNVKEVLTATVDRMVPVFLEALDQAECRREQEDRRRFDGRREWNARVTSSAIEALVGISGRLRPDAGHRSEDPLFEAARAVADALGIEARPAPGLCGGTDPLREIANASGLRARTVLLRGQWWRAHNGPLVAFRENGTPVALLPAHARFFGQARYWIFDPGGGNQIGSGRGIRGPIATVRTDAIPAATRRSFHAQPDPLRADRSALRF